MNKIIYSLMFIFLLSLIGCDPVLSENPIHLEGDLIECPELEGLWLLQSNKDTGDVFGNFKKLRPGVYKFFIDKKSLVLPSFFLKPLYIFKINQNYYFECKDDSSKFIFGRLAVFGKTLYYRPLENFSSCKFFKENPNILHHEIIKTVSKDSNGKENISESLVLKDSATNTQKFIDSPTGNDLFSKYIPLCSCQNKGFQKIGICSPSVKTKAFKDALISRYKKLIEEDRHEFYDFSDIESDPDIDQELLETNLLLMSTSYAIVLSQVEKDLSYDKFLNELKKSKALNEVERQSYFLKTFPSIEEFAKTKNPEQNPLSENSINILFRKPTGVFKDHLLEIEKRVKKLLN